MNGVHGYCYIYMALNKWNGRNRRLVIEEEWKYSTMGACQIIKTSKFYLCWLLAHPSESEW
jgi:hypothetical protein